MTENPQQVRDSETSGSQVKATAPELRLLESDLLLRVVLRKLPIPSWVFGLLVFGGYYGMPFILNLIQGTLVSRQTIEALGATPGWSDAIGWLLMILPLRYLKNPMLSDVPHLITGMVMGLLGGLAIHGERGTEELVKRLAKDQVFSVTAEEYAAFVESINATYRRRRFKLLAVPFGLLVLQRDFVKGHPSA